MRSMSGGRRRQTRADHINESTVRSNGREKNGTAKAAPDCILSDQQRELSKRIFGPDIAAFLDNTIVDLAGMCFSHEGSISNERFEFLLSIITGLHPKDHLEYMQAVQMAVVHFSIMRFSRCLAQSETIEESEVLAGIVNKLTRAFVLQTEALRRNHPSVDEKWRKQLVANRAEQKTAQIVRGYVIAELNKTKAVDPPHSPTNSSPKTGIVGESIADEEAAQNGPDKQH